MLTTLAIFTFLMLLVTVLPLSRHPHWSIRGLDFPRLQFSLFAAILLLAQILLLDRQMPVTWALIVVSTLCLIWQLGWILPYTRLWPTEVMASGGSNLDGQLCILTSNVLAPNRNVRALMDLVTAHEPDVLVTLETNQWWEDELRGLEAAMPYSIKCPLENLYGMHVYSKLPLEDAEIRFLVEDDVPSMHTSIILRTGDKVRAHFLHPAPPSPTENAESAERDAELVIVARSVGHTEEPVIVTGDLNDVAWSSTTRLFRKISGLLDPRVGRGMLNTFHAAYPFVRWPLDHLYHSQHFTLLDIRRLPSIGSDHFPLLTRLSFTPSRGDSQNGLEASNADYVRSKAIRDKKEVSENDVPEPG